MGEGVRLKHENLSQNLIHQQSNHPQHPQQTIHTEQLLLETEDCNSIDYTIMDTSQQIVLDYLLSSEKGEILKRNGEELKKLKIGDKTYNFERGNPISKRLITKFNKIRQTMDYKKYELKEKRGIRWGQSGQEQSTHRHSNEIQSNHHQRTICFQRLCQFVCYH